MSQAIAVEAPEDEKPFRDSLGRRYKKKPEGTKGKGTRRRVSDKQQHIAHTVRLFINGWQPTEIARLQDISVRAVEERLTAFHGLIAEAQDLPGYEAKRIQYISAAEALSLKSVVEKLPEATCREATYAFDRLHNAGRLERNLSTANVNNKISGTLTYCKPQVTATIEE